MLGAIGVGLLLARLGALFLAVCARTNVVSIGL